MRKQHPAITMSDIADIADIADLTMSDIAAIKLKITTAQHDLGFQEKFLVRHMLHHGADSNVVMSTIKRMETFLDNMLDMEERLYGLDDERTMVTLDNYVIVLKRILDMNVRLHGSDDSRTQVAKANLELITSTFYAEDFP